MYSLEKIIGMILLGAAMIMVWRGYVHSYYLFSLFLFLIVGLILVLRKNRTTTTLPTPAQGIKSKFFSVGNYRLVGMLLIFIGVMWAPFSLLYIGFGGGDPRSFIPGLLWLWPVFVGLAFIAQQKWAVWLLVVSLVVLAIWFFWVIDVADVVLNAVDYWDILQGKSSIDSGAVHIQYD